MNKSKKEEQIYNFPIKLGKFNLIKLIGKGGMGEIFLAEDRSLERMVAIKRILPSHMSNEILQKRFLNEARIASKLTHTSIIRIYSLHRDKDTIYYSMPYIEGETLKDILIKSRINIKRGNISDNDRASMQTLMLIFLKICNAIYYTHCNGFLHRDIKPENIIIGKFQEVIILDWGVATKIKDYQQKIDKNEVHISDCDGSNWALTRPGKTVGTVEFMAPELVMGSEVSVSTDIYSLGASLYFILTLRLPFNRPNSLKMWRDNIKKFGEEHIDDPKNIAPHREITYQLSSIAMKCLETDPKKRFKSVKEIIDELHKYIDGRPNWTPVVNLNIKNQDDWKFQENVLIRKNTAISKNSNFMEWIIVMMSKYPYFENIRIKSNVKIKKNSSGLGLLMCASLNKKFEGVENGYLIWVGSKYVPGCKLFRKNVEVLTLDDVYIEPDKWYEIVVENRDNAFFLFIDGVNIFSYTNHLPIIGGHFGLVFKDMNLEVGIVTILTGNQNVLVNCIAIPDALFANKYYKNAISQYRRIANSFTGCPEGRDGIFRAGIALIFRGKNCLKDKNKYFYQAIKEFEKLKYTPWSPMEYLGKSMVYRAMDDFQKEVNVLEFALKNQPMHPLKHLIEEHLVFRLHDSSNKNKIEAYYFILLTIRYLPKIYIEQKSSSLLNNLLNAIEPIPFIKKPLNEKYKLHVWLSQQLSFYLAMPSEILNITLDNYKNPNFLENGLTSLMVLKYEKAARYILSVIKYEKDDDLLRIKKGFDLLLERGNLEDKLEVLMDYLNAESLIPFIENEIDGKRYKKILPYLRKKKCYEVQYGWALLMCGKVEEVYRIISKNEQTVNPSSPYYILKACYLAKAYGENASIFHFNNLAEDHFPSTTSLLGHFIKNHISLKSKWINSVFFWEKIQLYRQLTLYHHCLGEYKKENLYGTLIEKEFQRLPTFIHF